MPRAGSRSADRPAASRRRVDVPAPAAPTPPAPTSASDQLPPASAPPSLDPAIDAALAAIETEFSSYVPHPDRVAAACDVVRQALDAGSLDTGAISSPPAWLTCLLPLPARRGGAIALPVFDLLAEVAATHADPWPVLAAMLASHDDALQRRTLALVAQAARDGRVAVTQAVIAVVATRVDEDDSALGDAASLALLGTILARASSGEYPATPADACRTLLSDDGTASVRRAAARVLDLGGGLPGEDLARWLLGDEAHDVLGPYLAFTRATHQDLLDAEPIARDPAALASFRHAEHRCGAAALRSVVSAIGWARCNVGLEVTPTVGLSLSGGFPLLAGPDEARLFDELPGVRRVFERTLVTAVGCRVRDEDHSGTQGATMARFRAANVRHADVLTALLDVAPLTHARLDHLLQIIGELVDDFAAVFGGSPAARDEIASVQRVHADLRDRIAGLREAGDKDRALSAGVITRSSAGQPVAYAGYDIVSMEICRLVLPFDDPAMPHQIRTLHGLKRYLHQRGLTLALSLIGTGGAAMRTVDLAVVSGDDVEVGRHIEFVDLDPRAVLPGGDRLMPSAVRVAAEAFGRQLLHRQRIPSHVRVFCYGHEVHYFARFRNHPAFIRIDYSPPLRGGMIDLQYVGVSNYDLDVHPCVTLDAIRHLFQRLDFIVSADSTSIHARYDKERAVALDQLHRRTSLLFALVPYLMDLDWTIGSLALDVDAKALVARAWADFFVRSGVLPYHQFLTRDRSGILTGVETGADGERETAWPGSAPYRDRFTGPVEPALAATVGARLESLELRPEAAVQPSDLAGQLRAEAGVLRPLRAALARGEIAPTAVGLARRPPAHFRRVHEVERLAWLLHGDTAAIAEAAYLAHVVPLIERHVRFSTIGRINGCPVDRATLSLGPRVLTLAALRDTTGTARLACATDDECFWARRDRDDDAWQASPALTTEDVLEQLRAGNILGAAPDALALDAAALAAEVAQVVGRSRGQPRRPGGERDRTLPGTAASPGRAAGLARLGSPRADAAGEVVVSGGLDVLEAPCLLSAAAIVATGGGILSHLGLLAVESGTPALVIDAAWEDSPNGERVLTFAAQSFTEVVRPHGDLTLVERRDWHETRDLIHDGDLVVVDADGATLTVLGRAPAALVLFECLRQHARACRDLDEAGPDQVLVARGHHLRTRHQLAKALGRTHAPALVRFAAGEILLGPAWIDSTCAVRDGAEMLRLLGELPAASEAVREEIQAIAARVAVRVRESRAHATSLLARARTFHDALALRVNVARSAAQLQRLVRQLDVCGLDAGVVGTSDSRDLDQLVLDRVRTLRQAAAERALAPVRPGGVRPALEQLAMADDLLAMDGRARAALERLRSDGAAAAQALVARLSRDAVIASADGGVDLAPLVGGKAANLAEIGAVLSCDHVPPWFAVTDAAFRAVLAVPLDGAIAATGTVPVSGTLGDAIARAMADPALTPAAAAEAVRRLWIDVRIPDEVAGAVTDAYRAMGPDCEVAIRSSAFDEDTSHATRAGLFETCLSVRGEAAVLRHLAQVWAGMWSERALLDRAGRRDTVVHGGGVVVQRMVRSRISGVVQTINVAESRPCELVINVGLGLGEGIVRGTVAADHVVVAKESVDDAALRFRYLTADKRTRIVVDERFGAGTTMVETLAHQRLRPAIEYQELVALVTAAVRLETAWAQPLDIEFAFEEADLRILQVRPVPSADAVWRDTIERFPFGAGDRRVEERP